MKISNYTAPSDKPPANQAKKKLSSQHLATNTSFYEKSTGAPNDGAASRFRTPRLPTRTTTHPAATSPKRLQREKRAVRLPTYGLLKQENQTRRTRLLHLSLPTIGGTILKCSETTCTYATPPRDERFTRNAGIKSLKVKGTGCLTIFSLGQRFT